MRIRSSLADADSTVLLNDCNLAVLPPRWLRKHIARLRLHVAEQVMRRDIENGTRAASRVKVKPDWPAAQLRETYPSREMRWTCVPHEFQRLMLTFRIVT